MPRWSATSWRSVPSRQSSSLPSPRTILAVAHAASAGARAMVETVDRVLDALGYAGDRAVG